MKAGKQVKGLWHTSGYAGSLKSFVRKWLAVGSAEEKKLAFQWWKNKSTAP